MARDFGEVPLGGLRVAVVGPKSSSMQDDPKPQLWEYAWWRPWACKRVGGISVSGRRSGRTCRARGCLPCHEQRLRQWMDATEAVSADLEEERWYVLRLTPSTGRVETRDDVRAFLKQVHEVLGEWREAGGLRAAWWVAEVVAKPDEEPTAITCPYREWCPVEPSGGILRRRAGAGRGLPPVVMADIWDAHLRCVQGDCHLCLGRGVLPSVHLHVHVAALVRPLRYSDDTAAECPVSSGWWEFPTGERSFGAWREARGMGHADIRLMRSRTGAAAYLSKGARLYMSKGAAVSGWDLPEEERGEVDHVASQWTAELASAVIGSGLRSRGTLGRAYGLRRRERNAASRVEFCPDSPREDSLCPIQGAAMMPDHYQRERVRERELSGARRLVEDLGGAADAPDVPVSLLCLGRKRALEAGILGVPGQGEGLLSPGTPKFPGSGTGVPSPGAGSGGGAEGGTVARVASEVPAGAGFSCSWEGVPLVDADEWWSAYSWDKRGRCHVVIGRGEVCAAVPALPAEVGAVLALARQLWAEQDADSFWRAGVRFEARLSAVDEAVADAEKRYPGDEVRLAEAFHAVGSLRGWLGHDVDPRRSWSAELWDAWDKKDGGGVDAPAKV